MKISPFKRGRHPKNLRQALDIIEELLSEHDYSSPLWDVLTALRGPDSGDDSVKYATTCVIRTAAFPSHPYGSNGSLYFSDDATKVKKRIDLLAHNGDSAHFRRHLREAFDALDLKLREENPGVRIID